MSKFGAAAVAALREAGFWIGPDCAELQLVVVRREQYAVARVWLRVGEDICLVSDTSDPYQSRGRGCGWWGVVSCANFWLNRA